MSAVIYTPHFIQFFDDDGAPLAGGKLYTYEAGTTTPKATYTTEAATVENQNPVPLDAAGRATIFINGSYRFDLFDSSDVLVDSTDNVTSFTTLGTAAESFFQSFSGTGSEVNFTLSEDLGDDEKLIMVFVDEGGGKGFDIQPISAYTVNGTALTFGSAPASGTNNIQVWAPSKLAGAAASSAAAAATSAAAAATSATNASNVENRLTGIASTSSVAIGTGSKSFTVDSGLGFTNGQFVLVDSDADGTNYMFGQVTSYASTTLQVNVTVTGGTGTFADWTITVSGAQGVRGDAGTITNIGSQPSATITATDKIVFADVSDSDDSKNDTVQGIIDLVPLGRELLGSYSASNDTSVDIGSGLDLDAAIDSTYDHYIVEVVDLIPATDAQELLIRTSTDGGSTFDNGASDYGDQSDNVASGVQSLTSDVADSQIQCGSFQFGTGTGETGSAVINLWNPSGTAKYKLVEGYVSGFDQAGQHKRSTFDGARLSTADVDAVRFFMASGNITSGEFYLYGVRKT